MSTHWVHSHLLEILLLLLLGVSTVLWIRMVVAEKKVSYAEGHRDGYALAWAEADSVNLRVLSESPVAERVITHDVFIGYGGRLTDCIVFGNIRFDSAIITIRPEMLNGNVFLPCLPNQMNTIRWWMEERWPEVKERRLR